VRAAIQLVERGFVPTPLIRIGIRRLLAGRLREQRDAYGADREAGLRRWTEQMRADAIAPVPEKANEQHYEVPPELFQIALGPRLKYSGAYWPEGVTTLEQAEVAMLDLTCERAQLEDGQDILELGCGWGSLTLHMARRFPNSRITAVSNSAPQRRFIEASSPGNVRVITADMNELELGDRFDRVVSVEMFEHMRNYRELLRRVRGWMRDDARLFVHVFCHRAHAYPYETEGADNWMGRHFFTGGIMPSLDLLPRFDEHLAVEAQWEVDGTHYGRTARAWRENLESRREEAMRVLRET
jgi:cyclopropane-fatty-acyl-phospholipid synthase